MTAVYWTLFGVVAFLLLFVVPFAYYRELKDEHDRWMELPGATSSETNPR